MPKRGNKKQQKQKFKFNIPIVLITVGIFFMAISSLHWYLRWQSLSLDKNLLAKYISYEQTDFAFQPKRIYIQWFLDTEITEQILVNNNWTIADREASHLASSANPGENGNIIIYGHNKREILGNIRALKGGEIVTITTNDGVEHQYQVKKIVEVNPDQIDYLLPSKQEILTLYTCSGFMDQKRFIVQAQPIK